MALKQIDGLSHPVIVSNTGRAPVVAQPGTGLNGGNTAGSTQYKAIRSAPTTRQPQK